MKTDIFIKNFTNPDEAEGIPSIIHMGLINYLSVNNVENSAFDYLVKNSQAFINVYTNDEYAPYLKASCGEEKFDNFITTLNVISKLQAKRFLGIFTPELTQLSKKDSMALSNNLSLCSYILTNYYAEIDFSVMVFNFASTGRTKELNTLLDKYNLNLAEMKSSTSLARSCSSEEKRNEIKSFLGSIDNEYFEINLLEQMIIDHNPNKAANRDKSETLGYLISLNAFKQEQLENALELSKILGHEDLIGIIKPKVWDIEDEKQEEIPNAKEDEKLEFDWEDLVEEEIESFVKVDSFEFSHSRRNSIDQGTPLL